MKQLGTALLFLGAMLLSLLVQAVFRTTPAPEDVPPTEAEIQEAIDLAEEEEPADSQGYGSPAGY